MRFLEPGPHDSKGFKDEESEAYRDMYQTRLELNAKFGCLGYSLIIALLIIAYIISLF